MQIATQKLTMQEFSSQRGVTLIELSWAMALGVLVAAGLFSAQRTSVDSFNGTIEEHRASRTMREAFSEVKRQIRSCRPDSILVGEASTFQGNSTAPCLTFQEPIGFDYASGEVSWGAKEVEDAFVAYFVEGDTLARYVMVDSTRDEDSREVIVDKLADLPSQPSLYFLWIHSQNLMSISFFVNAPGGLSDEPRRMNTMVRVEPVFDF